MRHLAVSSVPGGPEVQAALSQFLDRLAPSARARIAKVILYGSVARGEATPESDVDLLIVWRGSFGDGLTALVPLTTDILVETGIDISVHPVPVEEFERIAHIRTGFYENVERDGILVDG